MPHYVARLVRPALLLALATVSVSAIASDASAPPKPTAAAKPSG